MASDRFLKETHSEAASPAGAPIPEIKEEAIPVYFPRGVDDIVVHALAGDITLDTATTDQRNRFRLFDRPVEQLMHPDPEATLIGNLILKAEEKDVEDALGLIAKKQKENPSYLHGHVIARDPLGRPAKGTLLQLAAMGGDVDLKAEIKEDKDRGLCERLIRIGNLSEAEVAEQLKVINSPEAKAANESRNERILSAIKRFGKGILLKSKEYKGARENTSHNFKAFQLFCQPLIDQLERDLTPDPAEIVTSGYIYDPSVLPRAQEWFEEHLNGCRLFLMSPEEKEIHSDTNNLHLHLHPTKGLIYYFKGMEYNFNERELTREQRKSIADLFARQENFGKDMAHLEGRHQAACKALLAVTSKRGHTPDLTGFGGWWSNESDVFAVNGMGKLQSKLSSRDAQVMNPGIGHLVDGGIIPARTLTTSCGHFYHSSFCLGRDFYLGYYGAGRPWCGVTRRLHRLLENLCRAKASALQCYAIRASAEVTHTRGTIM